MQLSPGVYNTMATPFTPDGTIDEASLRSLVDFILGTGVTGLSILSMMGEFATLTESERDWVTHVVLEQVSGRRSVVVNVTHSGTDVACRLAREAARAGAAGVMAAPPTNQKNLDVVADYYRRVAAAAAELPLVLQDEPNATGVAQPAAFLARMSDEIENATAISLEEAPTPAKVTRLQALANRPLQIYGGLGGVYFLQELDRGAAGTMTGFAFPEILVEVYRAHRGGDRPRARELFQKYLPLIAYEGQQVVGLALCKELLHRRGVIAHAVTRHPKMQLDGPTGAELDELLQLYGLGGAAVVP